MRKARLPSTRGRVQFASAASSASAAATSIRASASAAEVISEEAWMARAVRVVESLELDGERPVGGRCDARLKPPELHRGEAHG
jgi:hypothetical protein